MEDEIVATLYLRRVEGQMQLYVSDSKGRHRVTSLDRVTAPGWQELQLLALYFARDIEGCPGLPF